MFMLFRVSKFSSNLGILRPSLINSQDYARESRFKRKSHALILAHRTEALPLETPSHGYEAEGLV